MNTTTNPPLMIPHMRYYTRCGAITTPLEKNDDTCSEFKWQGRLPGEDPRLLTWLDSGRWRSDEEGDLHGFDIIAPYTPNEADAVRLLNFFADNPDIMHHDLIASKWKLNASVYGGLPSEERNFSNLFDAIRSAIKHHPTLSHS